MKLFVDPSNIASLKLVVAKEFSKIKVENVEQITEEKQHAVFKNDVGQVLTSSNATTRYLCGDDEDATHSCEIDQWLEWEAAELKPVVQTVCANVAQSGQSDLLPRLKSLLGRLEQAVKTDQQSIVKGRLGAADVAVWSTLYPCLCEGSTITDLLSEFANIKKWFSTVGGNDKFSKAIGSFLPAGSSWDKIKKLFPTAPLKKLKDVPTPQTENTDGQTAPVVTPDELRLAEEAWKAGTGALPAQKQRKSPILPQKDERNVLITSALPYVNNVPHLGNIIGCVLSADTFARFCRLRGVNTLYICGTDEYGTATETKALEEGLTPQQICDKYNKLHAQIYEWFNIRFDHFGRTTTEQQTKISQDIFWKLQERGHILKDSVDQLHCVKCDRFLADRFVEGTCPFCAYEDARGDQCDKCGKLINAIELKSPRCKVCGNTPAVRTSQHLFMDLPGLQPLLEKHLEVNFDKGTWSANTRVITRSWIRDGLKPRCISRDLKWGTPIPLEGYTDKVFYVWYDAPIGYISITANYTDDWEKWWKNPEEVELYNFMAKDNVPFHSVIFPSTLLGTGEDWTVVNHLSATEYLNYEDGKFSKSRGVGVFGNNAKDTGIPADVWRFYLLFLRPETQDSCFSWDDFVLKNNSELLNNLGNFINRALMFVNNNYGGVIPEMSLTEDDFVLLALVTRELKAYIDNLANVKLRDGIRNILSISRHGNVYIQVNKPWVKVKGSDSDKARAGTVVGLAANLACLLSVMVQPYMPTVSRTIQDQLNTPARSRDILHDTVTGHLPPGHRIGKPSPLFQKIESSLVQELKKRFAGKQNPVGPASDKPAAKPSSNKPNTAAAAAPSNLTPEELAKITDAVTKQGDKVRQLKAEKAEKSVIDREVAILLDLKKKLPSSAASGGGGGKGNPPNTAAAGAAPSNLTPEEEAKITEAVTKQGEKVRQLKAEKAEKSVIDQEVAILLDLKKKLPSPAASGGGGGGKGKSKKGKKK